MVENNGVKDNGVQKRSGTRWGAALLAILVSGAIVIFVLAIKWRDTLRVQRVVVEGVNTLTAKEIVGMTKVSPRALMYTLNLAEVRERISRHPFILSAAVYRQVPNTLTVEIIEREPVASINCGQLCYIDEEGVLLPCSQTNRKFDLPLISGVDGVQNAKPGKTVMSNELFEAIEICQTAQALDTTVYHMISEINMNNGGDIILYSTEAGIPVILGHGDVAEKLVLLENFWNNNIATVDIDNVRYIDLRFENQVVVKWAQQSEQHVKKVSS